MVPRGLECQPRIHNFHREADSVGHHHHLDQTKVMTQGDLIQDICHLVRLTSRQGTTCVSYQSVKVNIKKCLNNQYAICTLSLLSLYVKFIEFVHYWLSLLSMYFKFIE